MSLMDEMERKIDIMVDDFQAICAAYGMANQAAEELIITNIFLYKFLNDKFMMQKKKFLERSGKSMDQIFLNEENTLAYLSEHMIEDDFADQVQKVLDHISENVRDRGWTILSVGGKRIPLFDNILNVINVEQRNDFMRDIFRIIQREKFDFDVMGASDDAFDYYSHIFEHLINKYNVASGVYAEYYTPQSAAKIISRCLVGMGDKIMDAEIYDPAAGTGTLIVQMAQELKNDRPIIYTQDISVKSTRLLRLNLILNDMTELVGNAVQGDTLLYPAYHAVADDLSSRLKQFDYIVANPPFKTDFSAVRDKIDEKWKGSGRFFAGIPNVPKSKKTGMAAYTMFLQHILYSLKPEGRAAVIVPAGFLNAKTNIEKRIRKQLIDDKILKGVIMMPAYLFSHTGTNIAILFIDRANRDESALLMDASHFGKKIKNGGHKRTVLSDQEIEKIVECFTKRVNLEKVSASVDYRDIEKNNYSFSAGQYFYKENQDGEMITQEEFQKIIEGHQKKILQLFEEGHALESEIKDLLEMLRDG